MCSGTALETAPLVSVQWSARPVEENGSVCAAYNERGSIGAKIEEEVAKEVEDDKGPMIP